MKVIDLLNKIANGEEVPKKIHIKQFQCDFIFNGCTYLSDEKEQQNIFWCLHSGALNYEVEIIEEPQEHKIPEKLIPTSLRGIDNLDEKIEVAHIDIINAIDKINEILDCLEEINNG